VLSHGKCVLCTVGDVLARVCAKVRDVSGGRTAGFHVAAVSCEQVPDSRSSDLFAISPTRSGISFHLRISDLVVQGLGPNVLRYSSSERLRDASVKTMNGGGRRRRRNECM
jgi:hypothetical protein